MISLTIAEIAEIIGGRAHDIDPATVVHGPVEYDSRAITPGALFAAFDGEHVDGHDYVAAASAAGALAAIVSKHVDGPRIEVADVLAAITALAAASAARLDAKVIGVTGSSGKTSTKDLISQVLRTAGETVAPAGSMNNELGFPCTVLRANESTRFLVLELGARGIGHVADLAAIAQPQIGVVLNVGTAHLGEFGTRDAIAAAKGELVEALPAGGMAVLNADDQLVRAMASRTNARVVTFGESGDADVRGLDIDIDDFGRASFTLAAGDQRAEVRLQLVGEHHVGNALAAAAVALECGLALPVIAQALSAAVPTSRWRMEVTERSDGVTVINDAYNANPDSMRAALKTLATVQRARRAGGGRGYAVLGPMGELGPTSKIEHLDLGRLAVRLDIARVIAVGEDARPIHHGATLEGSWNGEATWVPDIDAAVEVLRAELHSGDVVLVKASRAASLERLALAILQDGSTELSEEDEGDNTA
jgi:UDP-N-acetylmuramoyl-tripeptide--D-alanyl-D-alanine ligase